MNHKDTEAQPAPACRRHQLTNLCRSQTAQRVMFWSCSSLLMCFHLLLAGCAPQGISVMAEGRKVLAADGYELLTYRLEQDGPRAKERPAPRALLFYLQGSENRSAMASIERLAGAVVMHVQVVLMERRGIGPDGVIDAQQATRYSIKRQRIADHARGIDAYLEPLKDAEKAIPVIVMGSSEGGDVAASIAAGDRRVTHLILLGSGGGWSQEEELRHFIRSRGEYLGLASEAALDEVLDKIRRNPDSDELWAGHPYRRWSSFLWDKPLKDLLTLEIPILLAHGTEDESVPVESARAVRDAFEAAKKSNLQYVEYPGVNHQFKDADGRSAHPLVELDVLQWLRQHDLLNSVEYNLYEQRVRANHPEWFENGAKRP